MSRNTTKSSNATVKVETYLKHRVDRIKLELERIYAASNIDLAMQVADAFHGQIKRQHMKERPQAYEQTASPQDTSSVAEVGAEVTEGSKA